MNINEIQHPEDIEMIQCNDCGASAAGFELVQEDIDLLKQVNRCLMCSADKAALEITAA